MSILNYTFNKAPIIIKLGISIPLTLETHCPIYKKETRDLDQHYTKTKVRY